MTEDSSMQRMTEVRDDYFADALTNMQPHCEDLVGRLTDTIRGQAVPRAEEAIIYPFHRSHATSSLRQYSHLQRSTPASISHFKCYPGLITSNDRIQEFLSVSFVAIEKFLGRFNLLPFMVFKTTPPNANNHQTPLLDMSSDQLMELMPCRVRRRYSRGLKRKHLALNKKLRKAKKEAGSLEKPEVVKTHLRKMVIVPEMVGSIVGVYNGKTFNQVEIKPEMIGHYLGEFSITYKHVKHGRPGIGATHSSRFIPLK
ncbi:RPS15 [Cordylochernes scorpioides]|uniref:40S ribosomal protein S15 n=1 Tax=Cordylochernes scorpioides TaxID=51811 RepID=A0ABY6L9H0_9ARAC|nr:RPS15 [Cordylochernes scorpioides]